MEFSGQYLTYEEYRALGGTLTLTPFNLLEFEARRQIDIRTFNRLKELDSADIPQEVKMCELEMINNISSYDAMMNSTSQNGGKKSENTDGYSVTYASAEDAQKVTEAKRADFDSTIRNYLLGVIVNGEHIVYCGADE